MSAMHELDRALVSGLAWTAVMRWAAQLISWIGTFYAARILLPSDYGLVGMAMLAIGLARMIEDFGLDAILLQDRTIDDRQQAQLAGLMLASAVVLCAIFALLARPVASFFREPQVASVIVVLSLLFITDALQVIPRAALQRRLAYGRLTVAVLVQTVVTQTVLVEGALQGWGFWALVFNSLSGAVVVTLLFAFWHPYPIRWPRDIGSLARVLLQGWRMIATRGAYYFYNTADQTIIGRILGKDALGAYAFAQTLSTTAVQEVSSVVSKVVPGIFSASQNDRAELRRYFLLLTEFVSYLTLPMSVGLALTADLVVPVVLGPTWDGVIAPLRLLCVFTAFSSAQLLISHVMIWTGQFRAQMWCTILSATVVPACYLLGVRYGLEGIAFVLAVVYPLTNIPPLMIGFRTISIGVWQWLGALHPAGTSCLIMSAGVLAIRAALPEGTSLALGLAVAVSAGLVIYVAALLTIFRSRLLQMLQFVKDLRHREAALPPVATVDQKTA
jgi:O-antigen/teichoic acid export membrane protein